MQKQKTATTTATEEKMEKMRSRADECGYLRSACLVISLKRITVICSFGENKIVSHHKAKIATIPTKKKVITATAAAAPLQLLGRVQVRHIWIEAKCLHTVT